MAQGDQLPFYAGIILIGGIQIPVAPGAAFENPFNENSPPIIGNYYESESYAPGLREPMITVQFIVRDKATECLSAAFLDYLITRTALPEHNTNIIPGGIKFWDGDSGVWMHGAKLDSLQIGFSKQSLTISARFVGANEGATVAVEALGAAPTFTAWDATTIIPGHVVTVWPSGAGAADCAISGSLTMSNNHRPNPCMNGSPYPKSMDASQFTAGLQLTRRATAADLVSGVALEIRIGAINIPRNLFVRNPRWQTGPNRNIGVPETFKTWSAQVKSGTANGFPIYYS